METFTNISNSAKELISLLRAGSSGGDNSGIQHGMVLSDLPNYISRALNLLLRYKCLVKVEFRRQMNQKM
ncbi:MAG: hypothetical protein ACTSYI_09860 [Promethearchaeota archaeon]